MTLLLVVDEHAVVHLFIEDMQRVMCDFGAMPIEHAKAPWPTCMECIRKSWTLAKRFPVDYVA